MLAMGVGPPESPAQGEAPNHRKLRRPNGRGGERCEKGDRERQHGLGLDDHQVLAPPGPEALQPYPNKAILKAEARVAICPQGDLELVVENKVIECDLTTGPDGGEKGAAQQQQ